MSMFITPIYKLTRDRQDTFLRALADYGDVERAADEIETTTGHVLSIRARDPAFRAAWVDAIERAWDKRLKQRTKRA